MNCRDFEDARLLAAYGEPAGAEFEAHQAICDDCRGEIEKIRSVRIAYARSQDEPMPAALRARIRGPRRVIWTLAAAAAALLVVWLSLDSRKIETPPSPPHTANIDEELAKIDQELDWHELVLER